MTTSATDRTRPITSQADIDVHACVTLPAESVDEMQELPLDVTPIPWWPNAPPMMKMPGYPPREKMLPITLSRVFQAGDSQSRMTPITHTKGSRTSAPISRIPDRNSPGQADDCLDGTGVGRWRASAASSS